MTNEQRSSPRMIDRASWRALVALWAVGCAHAHEAEVVSTYEPRATIGQTFTADTTRLQASGAAQSSDAGTKALTGLLQSHLAAVGTLRPTKAAADHFDLVADLPAPGWALRVRVSPKAESMCVVFIEPLATVPDEHAVDAAPWSVQDAFETVRRHAPTLLPSKAPPMDAARFARLRSEAAAAAAAGSDPPLTPSEFVRVPRPITAAGVDRPYIVPPRDSSGRQGP